MSDSLIDRLHGIIPPVITPFQVDGEFDAGSAARLCRYMIDSGMRGLFMFGSSSEGPALTTEQREKSLGIAIEAAAGAVPILVGVMEPTTQRVIAQAKIAKATGADALVVCPPYYYPTLQAEVIRHFRLIKEAVDLPILAYDIPATTKIKMSLETMLTLASEGTIVGAKDSSGDATNLRRLLIHRPAGFRVFSGSEAVVDTALIAGADGSVPGLANVAPKPYAEMYDHWVAGRMQETFAAQNLLTRLYDVFLKPGGGNCPSYAFGSMKIAMKLRGVIDCCRLTDPFEQITPEHEARVKSILEETGTL